MEHLGYNLDKNVTKKTIVLQNYGGLQEDIESANNDSTKNGNTMISGVTIDNGNW